MIQETIKKIEQRVKGSQTLSDTGRQELLGLLKDLKGEMDGLSQTDREQAQSITSYFDISTHEVTRQGKQPKLLQHSLEGLSASVDGFETSHPKLVMVVNRICTTLSNLGV